MSALTYTLNRLSSFSDKIDTGTATHTDFLQLQRLETEIIDYHNTDTINKATRDALLSLYREIKKDYRAALNLDR